MSKLSELRVNDLLLNELIEEINKLRQAKTLLDRVFLETGDNDNTLSWELLVDINKFYCDYDV